MHSAQVTSTQSAELQRPGLVTAIGTITMVNGILNVLGGLALTGVIVLGSLGIGMLCAPITMAPAVLGVFEIMYSAKILSNPPQPVKFSQTIAILEITCIIFGNFISLGVGILVLVFYSDQSVKDYFTTLNLIDAAQH